MSHVERRSAHVERFAPSPTGPLHLGHAYSAWVGWQAARQAGGRFLLRIEDLDQSRFRPEWVEGIMRDLVWLGLDWDGPVLCQSARLGAYRAALTDLAARRLTYACTCTRRDIAGAAAAPQEGHGPDGPVYPGTCRERFRPTDGPHALRLNMAAAIEALGGSAAVDRLDFRETGAGPEGETGTVSLSAAALVEGVGDVVLARRDGAPAYHLAVVVDDAFQGVTHVTRGRDLFPATPIHRLLQALLGLPVPVYNHHRLVRDGAGRRLAKRDDARAIAAYRAAGSSPAEVLRLAGVSAPG
ncbi:MAG TPA: tRNA glutamyl-Q(34) synthetase GluQRS [Paracoccaceae bacterium]|nr:tRNA glutamyl-Q(34) synthetase GluQRS [Paracoccaceae bacterium]